jgi:hypothetical protein
MKEFLLVLRGDRSRFDSMSADDQKKQISSYNQWVGELHKRGIFKDGLGLAPGHYEIRPDHKKTVDGPFTETKEVLTGFFQIEAESFEDAIAIGKTCPALSCHETVMVFQVGGVG